MHGFRLYPKIIKSLLKLGTYYYWSGYVNSEQISFRGTVVVEPTEDKYLDINVIVDGYQGKIIKI